MSENSRPQVIDSKCLFELRVSLRDARPSVWRSGVVSPETTFRDLHNVLQAAMGWHNYHLYRFGWTMRMGGRIVADSYWETYVDDEGRSYPLGSTPIGAIQFWVGDSFVYVYDLGDEWVHNIRVEKKPERKSGRRHPWVVDGKGQCPPEDSGGPYLYPVLVKLAQGKDRSRESSKSTGSAGDRPGKSWEAEPALILAPSAGAKPTTRWHFGGLVEV